MHPPLRKQKNRPLFSILVLMPFTPTVRWPRLCSLDHILFALRTAPWWPRATSAGLAACGTCGRARASGRWKGMSRCAILSCSCPVPGQSKQQSLVRSISLAQFRACPPPSCVFSRFGRAGRSFPPVRGFALVFTSSRVAGDPRPFSRWSG